MTTKMKYGVVVAKKDTKYDSSNIVTVNFDSSRKSVQISKLYSGQFTVPYFTKATGSASATVILVPDANDFDTSPYIHMIESMNGLSFFTDWEFSPTINGLMVSAYLMTQPKAPSGDEVVLQITVYIDPATGPADFGPWTGNFRVALFKIPFNTTNLLVDAVYNFD
jgi:hypothetical protein